VVQLFAHYHLWIIEGWDSDLMVHCENLFHFFFYFFQPFA
jgi:hypothetical protein